MAAATAAATAAAALTVVLASAAACEEGSAAAVFLEDHSEGWMVEAGESKGGRAVVQGAAADPVARGGPAVEAVAVEDVAVE
eukprot:6185215-Pleurochrysis_carterae.AAC.1